MKCQYCGEDFEENQLDCSHDIPKYIGGTDLDGRHWLCTSKRGGETNECHEQYEKLVLVACLKYVGEEFQEEEDMITWMKVLKQETEELKKELRKIAIKIKRGFYDTETITTS